VTTRAPARDVGHLTDPGYRAGNSLHGDAVAVLRGQRWVDRDMRHTKDRHPINTHWAKLWRDLFSRNRRLAWAMLTWAYVKGLVSRDDYPVRDMFQALTDAHARGLSVEVEAKDFTTVSEWRALAAHAESLWSAHWREHVNAKCLTTVWRWRRILRNAHAADWPTIALVRGPWRYRAINSPSITYVRGASARVKYPRSHA
jgi:hypothetical protein